MSRSASEGASELERGRQAYASRSWAAACEALDAAWHADLLDGQDLWRLAMASYLVGDEERFGRALEAAHHKHLEAGELRTAARCAFWIGFQLVERGEMARASGWFGRASRVVERVGDDCAERGYVLLPTGHQQLAAGEYEACFRTAGEAQALGERFADPDLLTLALHMRGRALLRQGRVSEGLALLDEAMVAVVSDELSPQVTGMVYCSVISACREVHEVRRAREWTGALAEWCARQPDMVTYTGECHVYRAEILLQRGQWGEAIDEARRASARLADGAGSAIEGAAYYQQGEVHRLRGAFAAAEDAYRAASAKGREPQPGLALLRLAQGDSAAAAAATRRALSETTHPFRRARLLPAHIEVMLAAGHLDEAREACGELAEIAEEWGAVTLATVVAQQRGAIELAAGQAEEALPRLREAWQRWKTLDMPYEIARTRALLGMACRELGDMDGALLEVEAARAELERLGAATDLARLDAIVGKRISGREHGLTPREREVLALLATGKTNRAIGQELFISEKTVARHVANIYGKLGLSSRSAATAYAYEHDLLGP